MEGIQAGHLLADKGYDSDAIVDLLTKKGITPVIPPRRNRTLQRNYNKAIYQLRHLVENAFLYLKQWRGIATRYAKHTKSFLAALQIRCMQLWIKRKHDDDL